MPNVPIKLLLNWYELQGKNLIGEEELHGIIIEDVLALFEMPFWNGVYHCWAIEAQHINILQQHVNHPFQPEIYAYFLEAFKSNAQSI